VVNYATLLFADDIPKKFDLSFHIYDILGKAVKQTKITSNRTTINFNNLADGIYIYKLSDKEKIITTGKIIIN